MSKYIPAVTDSVQSRMPINKWRKEVKPQVQEFYEDISLSTRQEQMLLLAVSGDKDSIKSIRQLFKGMKLYKQSKWRGYTFVYLVYSSARKYKHLFSTKEVQKAYKNIFNARCHSDYPVVVANYENFYVVPSEEISPFVVSEVKETDRSHVENVVEMLQGMTKSNRTQKTVQYNRTPLEEMFQSPKNEQTLEELDANNKELLKTDMEFVFQYANDKNLLKELMADLLTSTPEQDLQRSVDLFSQKSMMYDFFTFMRSKGISIA